MDGMLRVGNLDAPSINGLSVGCYVPKYFVGPEVMMLEYVRLKKRSAETSSQF